MILRDEFQDVRIVDRMLKIFIHFIYLFIFIIFYSSWRRNVFTLQILRITTGLCVKGGRI